MEWDEMEARLLAVEALATSAARATQEPLLALIDWIGEESVNDLGATRGRLLALEAFARAAIASGVCGPRFADELRRCLARAEADALVAEVPERAMRALQDALAATGAALLREVTPHAPRHEETNDRG